MSATPILSRGVRRFKFGERADGTQVEAVELSNARGSMVRILSMGCIVQSLCVPDDEGEMTDVVLGHNTVAEYESKRQYFGATVGRYANRIAHGKFSLDGRAYNLDINDAPNHLHGGVHGFDAANWVIESVSDALCPQVILSHASPDGEGGYPGNLQVTAAFSFSDTNELSIEYRAITDRATLVNITHHGYFNLEGEGSDVMDHRLMLYADYFTPIDATSIPFGELQAVANTAFDFTQSSSIGKLIRNANELQLRHGRGYDHNFVIRGTAGALRPFARVEAKRSGRILELFATSPGVQFYSGNFLDGTTMGKHDKTYRQGDGFCLEPQVFPDAPNHTHFPSARLDPGQTYSNKMIFKLSVA